MDPQKARLVTEFLTKSTAKTKLPLNLPNYQVASKTGTSRKSFAKGDGSKLYTSAIGYLPASDPQVVIYVIVDSAQGGEIWGSTVAVPVFAAVAKQVARIMNLKSDKSEGSGFKPCTRPLPDLEEEKAHFIQLSKKAKTENNHSTKTSNSANKDKKVSGSSKSVKQPTKKFDKKEELKKVKKTLSKSANNSSGKINRKRKN